MPSLPAGQPDRRQRQISPWNARLSPVLHTAQRSWSYFQTGTSAHPWHQNQPAGFPWKQQIQTHRIWRGLPVLPHRPPAARHMPTDTRSGFPQIPSVRSLYRKYHRCRSNWCSRRPEDEARSTAYFRRRRSPEHGLFSSFSAVFLPK